MTYRTCGNYPLLDEVIEVLLDKYPDRIPAHPHVTLEQFTKLQGQQDVIRYLLKWKDDIDNIGNNTT